MEKETVPGVELVYFICVALTAADFEPLHGFLALPVVSQISRTTQLFWQMEKILM